MSQELQRCPHCGAYVMSQDTVCPRCDRPLDNAPAPDTVIVRREELDAAPASEATQINAGPPAPPQTEAAESAPENNTPPAEDGADDEPESGEPAPDPPTDVIAMPAAPTAPPEAAESDAERAAEWIEETPTAEGDTPTDPPTDIFTMPPVPAGEVEPEEESSGDETPATAEESADRAAVPTTELPHVDVLYESGQPAEDAEPDATTAESGPEPDADAAPVDRTTRFSPEEVEDEAQADGDAVEEAPEAAPPADTLPPVPPDMPEEAPSPDDITPAREASDAMSATQPRLSVEEPPTAELTQVRTRPEPRYIVPPAPYTPPPVPTPPPPAAIVPPGAAFPAPAEAAQSPGMAYLQQRVRSYAHGGYRLLANSPYEAVLSCGKNLGFGGWLLALSTGIGFAWYLLLIALSGFRADRVYITLEADGRVYEDGSGAAHVRLARARGGRRWAAFGGVVFLLSLLLALVLGIVAGVFLSQERYQAALREAYPAVTLFEERFSPIEAAPDDVALAKDGLVAWSVLGGIAVVGVWGGATLFVIGTVHAGAYRVPVEPLPGWA